MIFIKLNPEIRVGCVCVASTVMQHSEMKYRILKKTIQPDPLSELICEFMVRSAIK